MSHLFSENSPIVIFLNRFFDLLILNWIFLFTCLPVITIGPAITALYAITLRMADGDNPYIIKTYFRAFAKNFKGSLLLWLPLLFGLLFFGADLYIVHTQLDESLLFLQFPIFFFIFCIISIILYAFPVFAIFDNSLTKTTKNALLLSLSNLPLTIFTIMLIVVLISIAQISSEAMWGVISIFLFVGCSVFALILSFYFLRIFKKIAPEEFED